jgi:hypothetical protein
MQKFINIAEQYVEWLALGIGVVYLGFMGWSYGYQPTLNVTIAGKSVEPGQIEKTIADGPIKDLDEKIQSSAFVPIEPPDVVAVFIDSAGDKTAIVSNYTSSFQPNPLGGAGSDQGPQEKGPITPKLAGLPKPPATIPVAIASYRTLIEFADPKFDAAAAAGGAVVPIISKDIDAVSFKCKVDAKTVSKAFSDAFGANASPKLFQTMYLRVHLWREEQSGPDKWSQPVEILPLVINPLPDIPQGPVEDQPAAVYRLWAGANQDQILHPPFYQTAKDAPPWVDPEQAAAAAVPAKAGAVAVPPAGAAAMPPAAAAQNPAFAGADLATGMFNPLQKVTDDFVIAHDETVKPDKTYRYYVQYSIFNPLFHLPKLGGEAAIKQFELSSPGMDAAQVADMSQPISIPSRTQIFVKSVQGSTVHFAVFQWSPQIKETEIVATAGDTLAPSPYMLVDVRQEPSHASYVLLVNPDGIDMRHDVIKDQKDPTFIQNERDAAAAANPTVGPVTPTTVAPGIQPPGRPGTTPQVVRPNAND